jgi:hypothetical protein
MALMTVYCARNNNTSVTCEIRDLGAGAGEITRLELGAMGIGASSRPRL